jgi:hypothetical protein
MKIKKHKDVDMITISCMQGDKLVQKSYVGYNLSQAKYAFEHEYINGRKYYNNKY